MKDQIRKDLIGLVAFVLFCFAAAGIGWIWTNAGLTVWYPTLKKPGWTPPNRVFGPVWSILYLTMAIAGWLVWRRRDRNDGNVKLALLLFAVQLGLNAIWSYLFFTLRNPGIAFAEITLLWLAILATLMLFWRISRVAALLLIPYWLWVTFASILNLVIWVMNS
ncbi:TspO/MBR family protein [Singulisphaera sp. Ch08]|uniref:TspO/MBR family protein n=1 Tax=Singulisphaera sp. Ch08 TaxID=3120278 RepID=A0AAU7C9R3_9BACT